MCEWAPYCGFHHRCDWWGSWDGTVPAGMARALSPASPALPWLPWPAALVEMDLLVLIWWIIFGACFTCVPCFPSGREQHQKHLQSERRVCATVGGEDLISKNTKPPFHLSSQTSSFHPDRKENGHHLPAALGTPCTTQSINSVVISCQVLPALMCYANHSCRRPSTLEALWMEMVAETHFSVFSLWWWKVLVWQEQGLKLLVAFSLELEDCPAQKDTLAFFTTGINDRWGTQGYPALSWLGEDWRSSWHHHLWA